MISAATVRSPSCSSSIHESIFCPESVQRFIAGFSEEYTSKEPYIVESVLTFHYHKDAFIRRMAEAGNKKANGMRRMTVTYHDIGTHLTPSIPKTCPMSSRESLSDERLAASAIQHHSEFAFLEGVYCSAHSYPCLPSERVSTSALTQSCL